MNNLIISVDEARKILGNTADSMSDEEVEKLILDLDFFAHTAIKSYLASDKSKDETPKELSG